MAKTRIAEMTVNERRAYLVFGQIATLADLVQVLFADVLESIPREAQDEAKKVFAGQNIASQIALLAHIGAQDVSGDQEHERKDARHFLMPPAYFRVSNNAAEVEA